LSVCHEKRPQTLTDFGVVEVGQHYESMTGVGMVPDGDPPADYRRDKHPVCVNAAWKQCGGHSERRSGQKAKLKVA